MNSHSQKILRILVVNKNVEETELLAQHLRQKGCAVRMSVAATMEECRAQLVHSVDVVVVDVSSNIMGMVELTNMLRQNRAVAAVVAVVGSGDEMVVMEALQHGADQAVPKTHASQCTHVVIREWQRVVQTRQCVVLEKALHETNVRCDALIDSSRDPIAYIHEGMHIRANAAYLEAFGHASFDDIEGMSLLDMIAPEFVADVTRALKQWSKDPAAAPHSIDASVLGPDGSQTPAALQLAGASYDGEPCIQVVVRRLRAELSAEALEQMLAQDPVTGLLTRGAFIHAVEHAINGGAGYALLLVEPDHYTQTVQHMGLGAADSLLRALGQRLQQALPDNAQAARMVEHQFAVLLPSPTAHDTTQWAERIGGIYADSLLEAEGHSLSVTVSIGGIHLGDKPSTAAAAVSTAHQVLQNTAAQTPNSIHIVDPGAKDRAHEERLSTHTAYIQHALEHNEFSVVYQPLIALHGDPIALYEVRVSLHALEDTYGSQPMLHWPAAQPLLLAVDRWTIEHAIAAAAKHNSTVLVPISERAMDDPALVGHLQECLVRHQIPGNRVVLVLHERSIVNHMKTAQTFRLTLANTGVRVGLRDFGASATSLQLLAHFSAEVVMLAPEFSCELAHNAEHQEKIKSLTQSLHNSNRIVVVDAVQDAPSMAVLFGAGVDYAQGNFLAPPQARMDYDF